MSNHTMGQPAAVPENIDLDTALTLLFSVISPPRETRDVPVIQALGMICAQDMYSPTDVPAFDRSPLDGFAFNSEDTAGATPENPAGLTVIETVYAGSVPQKIVHRGEAVKIMTGAMIPAGCDCVAAKECVAEKAATVFIPEVYTHCRNYIFRGSDVRTGTLLIQKGTLLTCVHTGMLAGAGIGTVPVFKKPDVGFLCSGDELATPGEPLPSGKIFNSNETLLTGRLSELGFPCRRERHVSDSPEEAAQIIDRAIDTLDVCITTGGVSVGDKDIFHDVFKILGVQRLFWRMNFKPGMSVLCGTYKNKLLICLSGNPFAAFTTLELLVKPVLERLSGRITEPAVREKAVLAAPFTKTGSVRRFVRGRLHAGTVTLPEGHSNGELFSLIGCNCFVDIPGGSPPLCAGSTVDVVLL